MRRPMERMNISNVQSERTTASEESDAASALHTRRIERHSEYSDDADHGAIVVLRLTGRPTHSDRG